MIHNKNIETPTSKLKCLAKIYVQKYEKHLSIFLVFVVLGCMAASISQIRFLSTSYSMKQFLPNADPLLAAENSVKKIFNLQQTPGFLVTLTLPAYQVQDWLSGKYIAKLDVLTTELQTVKYVREVVSLTTIEGLAGAGEKGGNLTVGPLLKLIRPQELRKKILANNLLTPSLISRNAKTVMIVVDTGLATAEQLVFVESALKEKVPKAFPGVKFHLGGSLAIQTDVGQLLHSELKNFIVLAFLVSILTLLIIFSNFSGVAVPLLCIVLANVLVLGGMAYLKIPFTVLSATIPILVNITVLAVSAHTMLRLDEELGKRKILGILPEGKFLFVFETLRVLFLPNLLAAFTSCVGFFTLITVKVPVIKEYGMSTAACVMLAWFSTNILMLGLLPLMPLPRARVWTQSRARWALYLMKHKKPFMISTLLLSAFMALEGINLNWSPRLFDDLPGQHPTRLATERIDKKLGGVLPLEVIVESKTANAWNEPRLIKALDDVLQKARHIKGIGSAQGLPDFLGQADLNAKSTVRTRQSIAETYFLYSLSSNNPVSHFLTPDGKITRLSLRLNDLPRDQVQRAIGKITNIAKAKFPGLKVYSTGMASNAHRLNSHLSRDLIFGFWQALFVIGLALALVFRSFKWALIACIPNLVPPAVLLGALALAQTPVKPGIALIFSIALGMSFNNTVYLLERIRGAAKENMSQDELSSVIRRAFYLESNPCMVSTLVVFVGFTVFLGSYFSLNRYFGFFMLLSIIGGLVGDLVLLPTMLKTFPWVLSRKKKSSLPSANDGDRGKTSEVEDDFEAPIAASIALFFILWASSGLAWGAPLKDAKDILKKARNQITSKDEVADVKLRIIEADGGVKERKMIVKRKSGAKNYAIARLEEPADIRGTAFLSVSSKGKEDQWLYLPSSKSTRRIVGGSKKTGILGSEITYEDLSASTGDGVRVKYLRDDKILGKPFAVIEVTGKKGLGSYSKMRSWISLENYLAQKAEYYGWDGKLIKTIQFKNYKKFSGNVWRATTINIRNLQNHRGTDLILTDLKVNQNLPDSDFSVQALESD